MTGRRGFSLVEALIALTMLGAGILVVGAALSTTNRAARDALDATVADHLVREKLEQLRLGPYGSLRDGSEIVRLEGFDYRRSWTVTRNAPRAGASRVEVVVSWSEYQAPLTTTTSVLDVPRTLADPLGTVADVLDSSGRTRSRTLTGYVADR